MEKPTPQFKLEYLQEYIQLKSLLEGEVPKGLRVSQEVFNWFREQRKAVAKNFNMGNIPAKDSDQSFMGVKLIPILKLDDK